MQGRPLLSLCVDLSELCGAILPCSIVVYTYMYE